QTGRGRAEEGGVGARSRGCVRGLLEQGVLLRVRVHRACAQVVVASRDQDDGGGRVQLQAGGGLRGRGREGVADDLAAADESEVLAAQCQALPARQRVGDGIRRGAGEQ